MLVLGIGLIVVGSLGAITDARALLLVIAGLVIIITTDEYGTPRIPTAIKKWG